MRSVARTTVDAMPTSPAARWLGGVAARVLLGVPAGVPAGCSAYLRRTLPATGFRVSADDAAADTLIFTGYGWSGSVTGNAGTTAVLLRPR